MYVRVDLAMSKLSIERFLSPAVLLKLIKIQEPWLLIVLKTMKIVLKTMKIVLKTMKIVLNTMKILQLLY